MSVDLDFPVFYCIFVDTNNLGWNMGDENFLTTGYIQDEVDNIMSEGKAFTGLFLYLYDEVLRACDSKEIGECYTFSIPQEKILAFDSDWTEEFNDVTDLMDTLCSRLASYTIEYSTKEGYQFITHVFSGIGVSGSPGAINLRFPASFTEWIIEVGKALSEHCDSNSCY